MKLFDNAGLTAQLAAGAPQNNIIGAAAELIGGSDIGGFDGLIELFARRGHGDTIGSWFSTETNLYISRDTLEGVLGPDLIRQVADSAGVSPEDASYGLARVLPQLVHSLAADGATSDTLAQLITRFRSR